MLASRESVPVRCEPAEEKIKENRGGATGLLGLFEIRPTSLCIYDSDISCSVFFLNVAVFCELKWINVLIYITWKYQNSILNRTF